MPASLSSSAVTWLQNLEPWKGFSAILLALAGYLLSTVVYNLFFSPLRHYPGPKLWAVSQIPFSLAWISGHGHKKMLHLHQRYGDVVRVTPNQLSFGYPEAWNDMMGHRRIGQSENGKDPDFWRDGQHLTIVGSDRERHGRLRKILSHGFSAQAMMEQQPVFQHYVKLMMTRLHTAAAAGGPIDLSAYFNWATFDLAGDLIFGEPFGCLEQSKYHPWVKLLFMHLKGMAFATAVIRYPFHDALIKLITPKKVAHDAKLHHEYVDAHVKKRMEWKNPRPDFMESMIRARDKNQVSHDELVANAHNLIVGGSETTGTTLTGTAYLLAKNRPVLDKLTQELRETFQSDSEIDLISVQKLDYMFAVLHEAMRVYPPVPAAIPRKAPPEGTMIGEHQVPGNTILGIWQWPMFHNPKFFRDPELFVPERWLGDPRYASDQKAGMQPFSVGPRNCIGKNLAYAEMRLILAHLIWNFDIQLEPQSENWLNENLMYFLWQKPELFVRLIPRQSKS